MHRPKNAISSGLAIQQGTGMYFIIIINLLMRFQFIKMTMNSHKLLMLLPQVPQK